MLRKISKRAKSAANINIVKLFSGLALAYTIIILPVSAQQIIVDGNTKTALSVNGNTTTVTTATIKNNNAFNSFHRFNVDRGKVVNLVVPENSNNLINLVHSEATTIKGVLNSLKNNQIDGNVFIVNPHGITISSQGVINVGSLVTVTPTHKFMDKFFLSPGLPREESVQQLINGTVQINNKATIINEGEIRAIESVKLDAGNVVNHGKIQISPADINNSQLDVSDMVNVNNLEEGSQLVINNGRIIIKASDNVINSGHIIAEGSDNLYSGNIDIEAGKNILIDPGSFINATGTGGNISMLADKNIYVDAQINATGQIKLTASSEVLMAGKISSQNDIILHAKDAAGIITTNANPVSEIVAAGNIELLASNKKGSSFVEAGKGKSENVYISAAGNFDMYSLDKAYLTGSDVKIQATNVNISVEKKDIDIDKDTFINAIKEVNLTTGKGKANIDGTIIAGIERDKYLLVKLNGKIDPSSTFTPIIQSGNIIIDEPFELGGEGGIININAKKVNGKGTLIVNGGSGDVDIINNSTYNLLIKDLEVNEGTPGSIYINDELITSKYNKIDVILNNYEASGDINITNNSSSNVLLDGNIRNSFSDVNIINAYGSILNVNNNLIASNNINLKADNAFIGNSSNTVNIDTLSGSLQAIAKQDINITEIDGNLSLNLLKSTSGNVYLTALDGSIVSINNTTPAIIAKNALINTDSVLDYLNLQISGTTTINANNSAAISGKTGNLTVNSSGTFDYRSINANDIFITSGGNTTLYDGNITGNVKIVNNSSNITSPNVKIGNTLTDVIINGDLDVYSSGDIFAQGTIDGTITAQGLNIIVFELDNVSLNHILANKSVTLTSINAKILDSSTDENANILAKNILLSSEALNSGGVGTEDTGDININLLEGGSVKADSLSGNIYLTEINGDLIVDKVQANNNDVYLKAEKNVIGLNDNGYEANIFASSLFLTAGSNGNIGLDSNTGLLLIQTLDDGKLFASAPGGNIYIKETGFEPTLITDVVEAQDEIYLQANWKIQNFEGSTISTSADFSTITLVTDDTKLFDDFTNTGGTISTGLNGIVTIERETAGDIYGSYEGLDNLNHPIPGETTFVTTRELGTINSEYVEIVAQEGSEIWGNAPSLNIIIDDDYDFLNHPVDVADGTIYILRKTDGILTLGGYIDGIGFITQDEINNIKADNIMLGNVLDSNEWIFGDTIAIHLIDPDFSNNSSLGGPANVTLITSGSILDIDLTAETGLKAKNLTMIADCYQKGSGSIGNLESSGDIDIDLLENGALTAKAYDGILIQETNGALLLDKVESVNSFVDLSAIGDIIDNNNDSNINVKAANYINLMAGSYYDDTYRIGSSNNFVEIDSATSGNGYLSATAKYIYLEEIVGDLMINKIAGKIYPTNPDTHKAASVVYLKANDSSANDNHGAGIYDFDIINEDPVKDYNIHAIDLILEAKYGSIGSGDNYGNGDIDLYGANITNLRAEAGTLDINEESETINIYLYGTVAGGEVMSILGTPEYGAAIKTNENSTVSLRTNTYLFAGNNDDIVDIEAQTINLYAGYKIGETGLNVGRTVTIKLLGDNGYLNAYVPTTSSEKVAINSSGDMRINEVSGKYIILNAIDGSILNAKADGPNIAKESYKDAGSVRLTATGGSIGTLDNPIEIKMQNSYIITTSDKGTYLNNTESEGFLGIQNSVSGGDYSLKSFNNIMLRRDSGQPPSIVATNGNLNLSSSGDIYDYSISSSVLVSAKTINLNAGGNIGYNSINGTKYVDIQASEGLSLSSGKVTYVKLFDDTNLNSLISGGNVIIYSNADINLGVIDALNSNIKIDTTGSIYNSSLSEYNVIGKDITLIAAESIGTDTDYLNILYSGVSPVYTAPEVYVDAIKY